MHNHLYFVCPTDNLESIINKRFKNENYFYTSLGNSFNVNNSNRAFEDIKQIVQKYDIDKIYFALSNDNKILLDALEGHCFSSTERLKTYYNEVLSQSETSNIFCKSDNNKTSVISYYLNKKIEELQFKLIKCLEYSSIEIKGKIYNRHLGTFEDIYPKLICIEQCVLN